MCDNLAQRDEILQYKVLRFRECITVQDHLCTKPELFPLTFGQINNNYDINNVLALYKW